MSRVFWDTNLFIYLIEDRGSLGARVTRLAQRMRTRNDVLCTSTMTLGELSVRPMQVGDRALRQAYEDIVARHASLITFDEEAARIYAGIRSDKSIRAPDAIQLACAAKAAVDLFITNDERLSSKKIAGIQFVTSLDKAPI
jgi:predicted nucleic acid-binding protein